jgi:hypothetical protein
MGPTFRMYHYLIKPHFFLRKHLCTHDKHNPPHHHPLFLLMALMEVDFSNLEDWKCPFCPFESQSDTAISSVNRHVKYQANLPPSKRKPGHPDVDDPRYRSFARRRGFWSSSGGDIEEQKRKRRARKQKYRGNRKAKDEERVLKAFTKFRYTLRDAYPEGGAHGPCLFPLSLYSEAD